MEEEPTSSKKSVCVHMRVSGFCAQNSRYTRFYNHFQAPRMKPAAIERGLLVKPIRTLTDQGL